MPLWFFQRMYLKLLQRNTQISYLITLGENYMAEKQQRKS